MTPIERKDGTWFIKVEWIDEEDSLLDFSCDIEMRQWLREESEAWLKKRGVED